MAEAMQRTEVLGTPLSYVTEKKYEKLKGDRVITVSPDGTGVINVKVIHLDGPPKLVLEDVIADDVLPFTIYGVGYTDVILTRVSGTVFATIASSEK